MTAFAIHCRSASGALAGMRRRATLAAWALALVAPLTAPSASYGAGVGGSNDTVTQTSATVPTTATTGLARSFAFGPVTAEAPATCEVTIIWGDGTSSPASLGPPNAEGERQVSATHLYSKPGIYEATQSATASQPLKKCWLGPHTVESITVGDFVIGTNTTYTATAFAVAVSDPTPPSPPPPAAAPSASPSPAATPPVVAGLTQSHRLWRAGRLLARLSFRSKRARKPRVPVGTTFSFSLNEQATVSFSFTQPASGRTVKGRCVAPGKKNARNKRCKRTLTAATLSFAGHPGTNTVLVQGRVSQARKLRPGQYTLTVVAANGAGSSRPQSLRFTIVP